MGMLKRMEEQKQQMDEVARIILGRVGTIQECGMCAGHTTSGDDPVDAYKLANTLFTNGDPLVEIFSDRQSMTDTIKTVNTETPFDCGCYERWASDD